MEFDISDFKLIEILRINKKNLKNRFFKLTVENMDYILFIDRVTHARMYTKLYARTSYINEKKPIEHEIISYNKTYEKEHIDFGDRFSFYSPYLYEILENHKFEISEVNDRTIDFLNSLIERNEMTILISSIIYYENMENPTSKFGIKFSNFIQKICIENINADTKLQKKVIKIREQKILEQKAIEEQRKKEKLNEIKKEEFKKEIGPYKHKTSSDYNIRW